MINDGKSPLPAAAATSASFIRWLLVGVVSINLFVLGVVGVSLYQSHGEFEERAETTAQSLAGLLAEDIGGEIDKIDLMLRSAVDEIERQLSAGGIDGQILTAFLARLQGRLRDAPSLRAADVSGIIRYGSGVDPNARVNNSDREYFIRQRDDPKAGLVIAKPILARIDKKWVVPISRAYHLPDGSFGGVVYVNVALDRLAGGLSSIDIGRRGSVSLRDAGMRIYALYPMPTDVGKVIGEPLVVPQFQAMIEAGLEVGSYISNQTVDGVERKFAVHRLPSHPLYVVVGRATDEYMARWERQVANSLVLATLFSLATLIAAWLVYRNWRHQTAATLELAREEEKFHTVADYTYDWEYWEGPGKELLYISPACEQVTGYSRADFQADPKLLYSIIHPDDRHLMAEHLLGVAHVDVAVVDFRIMRRNGEIIWIAHGCQAVYGRDGRFMGRRASNRDITERKQAEAMVRQLNAELEQRVVRRTAQLEAANKELEEFSYSVSHDLRTPLRAIAGFSQILLDEHSGSLDSEGRRLLDVVRSNTVRMGQLIDDMLEFLRLGRRPMSFGPVDVGQLVGELFAELRASAPDRQLRLELRNPPSLWGDQTMIRRLLVCLLSNAIKFTRSRAEAVVEVGGSREGNENCYYVRDNGVGFDMQYVDKLFKVFEHVHPAGQFEGSGTGLAMVKRIVGRHGGRVWAEGQVDVGTTIHFTLPAKEARDDTGP